jgi:hypothetical protein
MNRLHGIFTFNIQRKEIAMLQYVTPKQVADEIKSNRKAWLKERDEEYPEYANDGPIRTAVYLHGEWLGKKLEAAGVSAKQREMICFDAGRRMFSDDFPKVVANAWNNWVDTQEWSEST